MERLARRFSLEGRVALVTGSSRGIGRALALGLAEAGADIAVNDEAGGPEAEAVVEIVRALGRNGASLPADLTQPDASPALVEAALRRFGRLDILVLNAALEHRHPWDAIPDEVRERELEVNFRSPLALIRAARPQMAQRGWGRILMLGSIQTQRPAPDLAVYAALKSASVNLARNLSRQLAPEGITVNVLSPGAILTGRNAAVLADAQTRAAVIGKIPLGRLGEPEDCVGAGLLLCSEAGRYITGAELFVDGGWHAA